MGLVCGPCSDSDADTNEVGPGTESALSALEDSGQLAGEWSSVLKPAKQSLKKILIPLESNHVKVLKTKVQQPPCRSQWIGCQSGSQGLARGCLWLHPQEGTQQALPALAPENSKVRRGPPSGSCRGLITQSPICRAALSLDTDRGGS